MIKKILIIPTFREIYKNQIEFSVDLRLLNFLKTFNSEAKIDIAKNLKSKKYDLLILSGGNDIVKFSNSKSNKIRSKYDNFFLKLSIKKNLPVIGICHGAMFIAEFFKNKLSKSNKHVGNHKVIYRNKKITVNSFHNYTIKSKKNMSWTIDAEDNSTEFFKIKNKKIFGVIWHPERYNKIRNLDKLLLKKIICY